MTWVEENIEETFSVYRMPRAHCNRMKSTNMLERYNEEIRRQIRVVRIFPNEVSCLRLVRALGVALASNRDDDAVAQDTIQDGARGDLVADLR